ncbi:DUF6192 family protein [Streptomyces sp. NPDC001508]|uniref:DUF6192 family protein n=1 Tax=Streptomyces sp. NPDC001508 TaxID=3154656 RepID=UPI0033181E07
MPRSGSRRSRPRPRDGSAGRRTTQSGGWGGRPTARRAHSVAAAGRIVPSLRNHVFGDDERAIVHENVARCRATLDRVETAEDTGKVDVDCCSRPDPSALSSASWYAPAICSPVRSVPGSRR